ncbi:hypothetical protein HRbin06_00239 [archaeon HR06]|nr:hypothetical protein HRbin06_00239 [archaeon HR06]
MKILYIDSSLSGISGDKFLSSLIDLGLEEEKLRELVRLIAQELNVKSYSFSVEEVLRGEFRAKYINLKVEESKRFKEGNELLSLLEKILDHLKLKSKAREFSRRALKELIRVEGELHKESIVHLHEISYMDTFVDIVGSALALDNLNLLEKTIIISSPIALGGGLIEFSHGKVNVPAPATLELLKGFIVYGGLVKEELTTPTGAAILSSLTNYCTDTLPKMRIDKIGYGAGKKDFPNLPNILRVILGEDYSFKEEPIYILETNLDDVTGETLGYLINKLIKEGAKDVNVIPMIGKKSRVVNMLRVICENKDLEKLSNFIFKETNTLGIRVIPCSRYVLLREEVKVSINIEGKEFAVKVKVAKDERGEILSFKPEFEEVLKIAEETNLSFKEVYHLVLKSFSYS